MALYVNTNVSSLNAQRKLANSTLNLNTSYQRLSSGLRINSAKDDAAGLMISNRLTAQINGLNQGNRNTNDGIALAQTVEGALDETTSMLQRIRTLAVQAANGTNTDEDRKSLQDEVTQLCSEIFRISQKTTFGGAQILDGTPAAGGAGPINLLDRNGQLQFQVGSNAFDTLMLDLSSSFKPSMIMSKGVGQGFAVEVIGDNDPNEDGYKDFWSKLANANSQGLPDQVPDPTDYTPFFGMIVTFAAEAASGTKPAKPASPARYTITTQALAQKTLEYIDNAIKYVDSKRSALGALQNRMESTIRNQSSISENEADARSRIRDTDFAAETAALTQNNIIQNASQTILAQANQRPQVALQLLGQ